MTLIEVLIASVMTAFIAIGTFTAFDAAGKSSADERAHAQGTLLAQQDQERLRSFTTTELEQMGTVETYRAENGMCLEKSGSAYSYFNGSKNTLFCEKVTGFAGNAYTGGVFTVTSASSYVSAEKGAEKAAFVCEKSGGSGSYLQTKSSVTWTSLGSRPPVTQSSVLTVPASYVLLVKVVNQANEPLEGATVSVTSGPSTTTSASGCVTFGGLGSETVEVSATKGSWIGSTGKTPVTKTGVKLSTTSVTEITLTLAEPGSIVAEFESNGTTAGVTASAFFAQQVKFSAPNYYVAASAVPEAKITQSSLFPWVKSVKPLEYESYNVYAGDCEANNPETVTASGEKLKYHTPVTVTPGGTTTDKVEVPAVNVRVYEGTEASKLNAIASAESAYITNEGCKAATTSQNGPVTYKHKVAINSEGRLETKYKYQPYAKELILCVIAKLATGKYARNTLKIENAKKAGTAELFLYLKGTGFTEKTKASELTCP